MKYSIIVPIYKVEKYLRNSVDSLLSQTFTDFELILVDDGSPDNCPAICDGYAEKDNRVKVIHKINGGVNSARKAGMQAAQGDYIITVDGDDFVESNMLDAVENILAEKDYDIVCFGFETFPEGKISYPKYREGGYDKAQIEEEIYPTLITGIDGKRFPPSVWGKAFKRELVTPVQLDLPDNISIGEDSCVTYVSVYKADSLYISHERPYRYRVDNESLTRGKKKLFSWDEPFLRADFYLKHMPEDKFGEQVARITAHSFFNVAVTVVRVKKYREAKREIKDRLSQERVKEILKKAQFKNNKKERLALYCLRHKSTFLIKLIAKVI